MNTRRVVVAGAPDARNSLFSHDDRPTRRSCQCGSQSNNKIINHYVYNAPDPSTKKNRFNDLVTIWARDLTADSILVMDSRGNNSTRALINAGHQFDLIIPFTHCADDHKAMVETATGANTVCSDARTLYYHVTGNCIVIHDAMCGSNVVLVDISKLMRSATCIHVFVCMTERNDISWQIFDKNLQALADRHRYTLDNVIQYDPYCQKGAKSKMHPWSFTLTRDSEVFHTYTDEIKLDDETMRGVKRPREDDSERPRALKIPRGFPQ